MTQERKGPGDMPGYVSYLLRLWREEGGQTARWRGSLQDSLSGERVGFASLEELFGYLRRGTGELAERDDVEVGREDGDG